VPQVSNTNQTLLGVDFIDTSHGCAVGTQGTVLYTADGGNTWVQVLTPVASTLTAVSMVDGDLVYAVGSVGTVLVNYTTSQGSNATWYQLAQPYGDDLMAIRMLDANNGWAVGKNGRILHTVDGGSIWDSQRQETGKNLNGVDFAAIPLPSTGGAQQYKYVGWAVGDGGRMLRTTDAGATWTQIDVGTLNTLRAFRFTDPDSGWAVGAFGTVEHLN
jgi:photosystem II stability/assembly factor-like uncharacterized protein